MSQYIAYCRKSSESEERQVLSIESQVEEVKALAQRQGLPISEILTESRSAKNPGRPIFNSLLKKLQKSKLQGVICWKLDRLARNPLDGSALVWALDQGQIKEIITPHGVFRNNSNDKFLMQIEFGMAKKYVDDLSDNVRRGNRAKLERGWFPGLPPLGYLNDPRERTIIKDPERFDIIRKAWDLLLRGTVPVRILTILNDKYGLRTRSHHKVGKRALTRSALYKLFGNPFYYGLIIRKEGVFQGKHEPMITEKEYWKAQEILGRDGPARPQKHNFDLTGLIKCAECGAMVTAEEKIKRGRHYIYYHCTKRKNNITCGQKYINAVDLEQQILNRLDEFHVPQRLLDLGLKHLAEEREKESKQRAEIQKSVKRAYEACLKRLNNLNQMRLGELIDDAEYMSEKRKILDDKIRFEEELSGKHTDQRSIERTEKSLRLANRAKIMFKNGLKEDKQTMLREVGSNFLLKDKKLLFEAEKPFIMLSSVLGVVGRENGAFELSENSSVKAKIVLSQDAIRLWWTTVDDVRKYYQQNPEKTDD